MIKKHINVLQIVGDPIGGIRKHVHAILLGLDSDVFKQSYIFSINSCDKKFRQELPIVCEKTGNRILQLKIKKNPGINDIFNINKLRQFALENTVDIVHGHGAKGGLYARIIGRKCGAKVIYTPHGGSVHKMFSRSCDFLYACVEKWLMNFTDYFLFESCYTANAFKQKIGEISKPWSVNYNGVASYNFDGRKDEARTMMQSNSSQFKNRVKIGVFGMLRMQKGQLYAIRALEYVLKRGMDIELHIFGDGPDLTKLKRFSIESKINEHVFFHGDVDEVETYMCFMDMIVVPSLYESFGLVAIEAFMLKKPVIASKVGGLCEIIDDETGILVAPQDPVALADAIIYLHEHAEYAKQLALAGYNKYLKQFTIDKNLKNIADIYKNLISSKML